SECPPRRSAGAPTGSARSWSATRVDRPAPPGRRCTPERIGFRAMRIDGSGALVAGGASGLGEATSRALGAAGARVVIADLNEDKGRALAEEIGGTFVRADVTDADTVQAAVDAVEGLRISVCCAGIGWAERVSHKRGPHQLQPFETVIRVNLIGTFHVLRLAAAALS